MFRRHSFLLTAALIALAAIPLGAFAAERFTDNGDGTVSDHQLGVMWAQADNQGDIDWRQSRQWVQYTFPDTLPRRYTNWRLPTPAELRSLYTKEAAYETDCGQTVHIFPVIRLTCGWVWTSETSAIQARVFNFQRGISYLDRMVHKRAYRTLPVRSLE